MNKWLIRVLPSSGDVREACSLPEALRAEAHWAGTDWGFFSAPVAAEEAARFFAESGGQRYLHAQEGWSLAFFAAADGDWSSYAEGPLSATVLPEAEGPYLLWRHLLPEGIDSEKAQQLSALSEGGRFFGAWGWQPWSEAGFLAALAMMEAGDPLALAVRAVPEGWPRAIGLSVEGVFWGAEALTDWPRRLALLKDASPAEKALWRAFLSEPTIALGALVLAEEGLAGRREDLLECYEDAAVRQSWRLLAALLWGKESQNA